MTETTIASIEENVLQNIGSVDTDTLKQYLQKGLEVTIKQVNFLAKIWLELETRGEDLSDLKNSWLSNLPLVAQGKLDAAVMVNFSGRKSLIQAMSTLPLQEQRSCIEKKTITIAKPKADGQDYYPAQTPINSMNVQDIRQVFNVQKGQVLTFEEQVKRLQKKRAPKRSKPQLVFDGKFLKIGMYKISLIDVINAVHQVANTTDNSAPKNIPIAINITTSEAQNLQHKLKLTNLKQEDYLYTILKSFNCFEK